MKATDASVEARDGRWYPAGSLVMESVASLLAASRAQPLPDSGVVDLAKIGRVDSAGVALMLAWKRRAAAEGHKLLFERVPPVVTSLAMLYGVVELLAA